MLRQIALILILALMPVSAEAQELPVATLYKRPFCGCCDGYADHLRAHGYEVTVVQSENMSLIKEKYDVPQELEGCHTITIGGYVVEGHVPATVIDRLLKERPDIRGISLPGMPEGSWGMTGTKRAPFVIYELSGQPGSVFARE